MVIFLWGPGRRAWRRHVKEATLHAVARANDSGTLLTLKQHFEKPSVKKAREKAEAVRRARKLARKKMIREGLL